LDYRTYHAINTFVADHAWLGRTFDAFENWGVIVFAVATAALWLFARPGGSAKWKIASASALAAAALALLVNRVVAAVWDRQRPFAVHPSAHVWGARSHDPSFPSDHASAAFAIGFALFFFDRVVGALFLAAAVLIAVGRVVVGLHYPGDVAAGLLVGLACAVVVVRFARPLLASLVRVASRLTDPFLAPVWNRAGGERRTRA
jgi:membrane-associated phospholipid phosphatase